MIAKTTVASVSEKDTYHNKIACAESTAHNQKRIWFFGHFGLGDGWGNFGNEGTLLAALYNVRRLVPGTEIRCICTGPVLTSRNHGIKAVPVSRTLAGFWVPRTRFGRAIRSVLLGAPCELFRWLENFLTLTRGDIILVPGTGLITDACGLRGWGPYNLFKWSLIGKLRGCKLLFVSVGVGPLYTRLGRFFAKSALALGDFRSYRDRSSSDYLEGIGFRASNDRVYPDLAFSLPSSLTALVSLRGDRRPIVGLGLILYPKTYSIEKPDPSTPQKYREKLLQFAVSIIRRGYDLRLLIGDRCDRQVTNEFRGLLMERLGASSSDRVLDDEPESVEQLLWQLAQTTFVVATRFHNVLFSVLVNKPVIAISFHPKVSSLMKEMELSQYCLDIHDFTVAELIDKTEHLECSLASLKSAIGIRREIACQALEEQYRHIGAELGEQG